MLHIKFGWNRLGDSGDVIFFESHHSLSLPYYITLEKWCGLSFINTIEFPSASFVLSLDEIGPVVLEKKSLQTDRQPDSSGKKLPK